MVALLQVTSGWDASGLTFLPNASSTGGTVLLSPTTSNTSNTTILLPDYFGVCCNTKHGSSTQLAADWFVQVTPTCVHWQHPAYICTPITCICVLLILQLMESLVHCFGAPLEVCMVPAASSSNSTGAFQLLHDQHPFLLFVELTPRFPDDMPVLTLQSVR